MSQSQPFVREVHQIVAKRKLPFVKPCENRQFWAHVLSEKAPKFWTRPLQIWFTSEHMANFRSVTFDGGVQKLKIKDQFLVTHEIKISTQF